MTTALSKRMIDIATGSAAEAGTETSGDIIEAGATIEKRGRPTVGAVGVEAAGIAVVESAVLVKRGRDTILLAMMIEAEIDEEVRLKLLYWTLK